MARNDRIGSFDLGHFFESDRTWLLRMGWLAIALALGLTVTGLWQFFFHEPDSALSGFKVGLSVTPSSAESTGVAAAHALLGDAAAVLALWGGAWFSYKVTHRLSWFAVTALVVLTSALLTGGVIRFNATVHDGVVDVATAGYTQILTGDAELAVTDRLVIGRLWMTVWTVLHIMSIPVIVGSAWFTLHHARRRQASSHATWTRNRPETQAD